MRTPFRSFNPRPRAGGDDVLNTVQRSLRVSIHAPARGATLACPDCGSVWGVSIHAPARGATSIAGGGGLGGGVFQSTPPRGGRPRAAGLAHRDRRFNPRPRAGGDKAQEWGRLWMYCFNPRPRAGGDREKKDPAAAFDVSIHAPARGATAENPRAVLQRGRFNPRPRAGGDRSAMGLWSAAVVSIHAPARGATNPPCLAADRAVFQSTPPRGGRPRLVVPPSPVSRFNPRPRAGGDCKTGRSVPAFGCFNPRPRAGGDEWLVITIF